MDNLTHTLVGAALAQTGLKRRTGLAAATLMIAANLPDLDALGLAFGENLAWRRGWTHGPIGLVLLPPMLAAAMLGFDRWQGRRGRRPEGRVPVHFGWLVALAYLGTITHPFFDLLNTYGVRLLMPFSDRWFYGDTLFIVDVWLWLALGLGVWLSRRREKKVRPRTELPAFAALLFTCLYIAAMGTSSLHAEAVTRRAAGAVLPVPIGKVVANPVPVDPLRRRMVFEAGDGYGFAPLRWTPAAEVAIPRRLMAHNMADPAVAAAARRDPELEDFLYWSRLPFARIERGPEETIVTVSDARYSEGPSSPAFTIRVRLPAAEDPGREGAPASAR
ncbi:metal-dependent hydrolase [Sphingosinicella terrae]|uniref:metal-dependent hydrolase n=1 Tax=Sphingosinicella terrae TaxID=2172047 RepID=UPI000E0D71D4|nr:metal-dependent hydrolase [Sphingosinicella terrae]